MIVIDNWLDVSNKGCTREWSRFRQVVIVNKRSIHLSEKTKGNNPVLRAEIWNKHYVHNIKVCTCYAFLLQLKQTTEGLTFACMTISQHFAHILLCIGVAYMKRETRGWIAKLLLSQSKKLFYKHKQNTHLTFTFVQDNKWLKHMKRIYNNTENNSLAYKGM